ncbi:iron ABC transporter permease [Clostridiaceae bacterium 35-E11]
MIKIRSFKHHLNIWTLLSSLFILFILLPNLSILGSLFHKANENWIHIKTYLLKDYIINSMILILFTGICTVLIGVVLAWLISVYDFPFRGFLKWALILPLTVPPYMAAYTYHGIVNYTGVIQTLLRNTLQMQVHQKYFDIMSMPGAVFIFTFFLFPYVYMITRSFLEKQSASLIENGRLLGRNSFEIFLYIILPISRTAIVGGVSLVVLEVLNDYGVVQYFGIPAFSTAIFKTWFAMGDLDSAVKLSSILMFLILCILAVEKILRGRKQFSYSNTKVRPITRQPLKGIRALLASFFCLSVLSLGFFIPTLQLLHWSLLTYKKILNIKFLTLALNSLAMAFVASGLIIIIALVIANYCRINNNWLAKIYSKITVIGYSIPAAVIAIGVIIFFIGLDQRLYWIYQMLHNHPRKLVLSTSIFMLLFAYIVRFLAIGYNSIESGFDKIGKKFFEASRLLGKNITQTFFAVDVKMIKPAILSGFILVFVDILKELPLTLILRPFNFHTLATKSFQYANDEMVHEAAISSLIIIIISVISIYFFYRTESKEVD